MQAEKVVGRLEDLTRMDVEQHAVDALDFQTFVVNIDDLGQDKAGRMVLLFGLGQALLDALPVGLGGGHRVIAVATA